MKYHFEVGKEDDGYSAQCIELEGCISQGDSMEDLQANLHEALNLYLDEPAGSNEVFPLPDEKLEGIDGVVSISVEHGIAFAMLVRQNRVANNWSMEQAQKAIGLSNRRKYNRLEKKCNPRLSIVAKVMEVYQGFPLDRVSEKVV